ncbi:MAG: hypothetical protein NZ922_01590 [Candidatus Methanomethyliaceae archaeon]|nr:hypothetical protein [Candidatus Methanomethyliaceae archaeon]MDW7970335.1 hypothetical protein [Nitrososphaerota archaeon]
MEIDRNDLMRIIKYAKKFCEDRCPAERDPDVCLALIEICRELNIELPSCVEETDGFVKSYFIAKIREIESRWKKSVREIIKEIEVRGARHFEEELDRMEAEFAVKAIKAIDNRVLEKELRKKSQF